MPEAGKGYGLLNAVVFILLEITAVVLLGNTRGLQDIWLNRATHRVLASMWSGSEHIRNYFSLESENRELAGENLSLSIRLREQGQLQLARQYGGVADTTVGRFRYIPATIVKASRNSLHNYIILNKGRADGVVARSGIVTGKGVAGIVTAVDEHFCYGLTLMNPRMSVSARIGHTGPVAPVSWNGGRSDRMRMRDIPLHRTVSPGDTVWTSGFSSVFPPDIPIGITGKTHVVDGSVNEVDVELFQDFGTLRFVTIVECMDRPAIEKLEKEAGR